ncbi:hypothetical protein MHO82_25550, partial [Vibrio sp. Of7-15]|uniref:hypothetical protein n=1 Tax=Vibrio sp. Of7-15 TaxID=2724879 RepID=UPI001EF3D2FC
RQKTQFTDEPDFRERATKTSGQVYSFLDLVNYNRTEQDTFIDFANLVADMDEGTAVQDGRFAGSVTPTQSDEAHQPVISNQSLLDTIDECAPVRADILVLDDPIALVEDIFAVTGRQLLSWVDWQEKNQKKYDVARAVTSFCQLQLDPSDSFAQELEKVDAPQRARVLAETSDYFASENGLSVIMTHNPTASMEANALLMSTNSERFNKYIREEGFNHPPHQGSFDSAYGRQMGAKEKWRSRVRLKEAEAYLFECIGQEELLKGSLQFSGHCVFSLLNAIGPDPSFLFFDMHDKEHVQQFIVQVNAWQSQLNTALTEEDALTHIEQVSDSSAPLINVVGSAVYSGVPAFKPYLVNLIDKVLSLTPNDTYHALLEEGHSPEVLSDFLDKANEISLQSGSADKSAYLAGTVALWDLLNSEELAQFKFYQDYVYIPVDNFKAKTIGKGLDYLVDSDVLSVNNWAIRGATSKIQSNWSLNKKVKIVDMIPVGVVSQLSGHDVTLTPENKAKYLADKMQLRENFKALAKARKNYRKSKNLVVRAKYRTEMFMLKSQSKKLADGLPGYITFTDAEKHKIAKDLISGTASKVISMAISVKIIHLNFLALTEDYHRILTSPNAKETDAFTLVYRALWLSESVLRIVKDIVHSQAISTLSSLKGELYNKVTSLPLHRAIHHKEASKAVAKSLSKLLIFGVTAELTLMAAGALETYQIIFYDLSNASGNTYIATAIKAAGTGSMAFSGYLGLKALYLGFASFAVGAFVFGAVGGLIYALATLYLNLAKDDDISEWLKNTMWGDDHWNGARIWEDTPKGYKDTMDALGELKNKPSVYTQPTLKCEHSVSEESVDGFHLMIDFPSALFQKKARVDVMIYNRGPAPFTTLRGKHDTETTSTYKDHKYFHVSEVQGKNTEWLGEWVQGVRPLPSKSANGHLVTPELSVTKEQDEESIKSLESWKIMEEDNQILKLWLPRPWMPTGVIGYRTCPAIVLVWYESDLDLTTGKPKENAVPHGFALDLSLASNIIGEDAIADSFKSVSSMKDSDREGFQAYEKALELARTYQTPKLLSIGS